jgi:hypothetical protein
MTTMDDLAAWLTARGLNVRPAPGWPKEAIFVSMTTKQKGDIAVLDNATIVHPSAGGVAVTQTRHGGDRRSQTMATLPEAAHLVARLVETGDELLWRSNAR